MKLKHPALATLLAALVAWLCIDSPAYAGMTVNAGSQLPATGSNAFQSNINLLFGGSTSVWTGTLSFDSAGTLQFYYHGAEADFINSFQNGADVLKTEANEGWNPDPAGQAIIPGLILTQAEANGLNSTLMFTSNIGPDALIGTQGFGIFRNTSTGSFFASDGRIYFGYDDDGAGPDDNHDDMIISAKWVTEQQSPTGSAPEPATLAVWSVLSGLGLIASRRLAKRKAS